MVHYKDDATAGDGEKKGTIRDKGIVNNKLSNALMQKLEKAGHPHPLTCRRSTTATPL